MEQQNTVKKVKSTAVNVNLSTAKNICCSSYKQGTALKISALLKDCFKTVENVWGGGGGGNFKKFCDTFLP
ncbi:MAG: hypothetical protein IKI28_06280, partial [Bacteroidales bacterium]|nr:hypothetical protein [Bacteroidales bacterium]